MTQTPVQPGIMDIALYVSGESTLAGRDDVLKLSSNENPLGPSPAAQDAFRKASHRGRLPVRTFEMVGRRGRFAVTTDIAQWLWDQRAGQGSGRQ